MPSPDQLFTLDPVKTGLTDPTAAINIQKSVDTTLRDRQTVAGLRTFSDAIGKLAEFKKQERIKSDVKIAQNAAIRNEAMPGGLLGVAVEAFGDITNIKTANDAYNEIKSYLDGEDVANIIKDSDTNSLQKNTTIEAHVDDLYLRAIRTMPDGNPETLLDLKTRIDVLKAASMKSVYDVEKNQQYGVTVSAINGNISRIYEETAFYPSLNPSEVLTNNWVRTNAKQIVKAHPWVELDDAKVTVLRLIATHDETFNNPIILENLLAGDFSPNVTFNALKNARTDPEGTGAQIYKIYTDFHNEVRRRDRETREDEKRTEEEENDSASISADDYYSKNLNDPDLTKNLQAVMQRETSDQKLINAYIKTKLTEDDNAKWDVDSDAYNIVEGLVASGKITTVKQLIQAQTDNNLNENSYTILNKLRGGENVEYKENLETLRREVQTVNSGVITALKGGLTKNPLDQLMTQGIKFSEADIRALALNQRANLDPNVYIDVLTQLQDLRSNFEADVKTEARKAASEDRVPDIKGLKKEFNNVIVGFVARIKAGQIDPNVPVTEEPGGEPSQRTIGILRPSDTGGAKGGFLDLKTGIGPTEIPSPELSLRELRRTTGVLIGAEQDIYDFMIDFNRKIDKIEDVLISPVLKTGEALFQIGKDFGDVFGLNSDSLGKKLKLGEKVSQEEVVFSNKTNFSKKSEKGDNKSWIDFFIGSAYAATVTEGADAVTSEEAFLTPKERIAKIGPSTEPYEAPPAEPTKKDGEELVLGEPTGRVTTEGRKEYKNNFGGTSTEYTIGVVHPEINNNQETHIPSIYNGKRVSQEEAEQIIIDNDGIDPETGRFITPGGDPEERSKSIEVIDEAPPKDYSTSKIKSVARNNPLNLRETNIKWQGKETSQGGFETFKTPELGIRAGVLNITNKLKPRRYTPKELIDLRNKIKKDGGTTITGNTLSLGEVINIISPRSDKNPTDLMIKDAAKAMNIKPTDTVDINDENQIRKLVDSLLVREAERFKYPDDVLNKGISLALGQTVVPPKEEQPVPLSKAIKSIVKESIVKKEDNLFKTLGKLSRKALTEAVPDNLRFFASYLKDNNMLASLGFGRKKPVVTEEALSEGVQSVLKQAVKKAIAEGRNYVDYSDYPDTSFGMSIPAIVATAGRKASEYADAKKRYPSGWKGKAQLLMDSFDDSVAAATTIGGFQFKIENGNVIITDIYDFSRFKSKQDSAYSQVRSSVETAKGEVAYDIKANLGKV